MTKKNQKKKNIAIKIMYGILGMGTALIIFYIFLNLSSFLSDRIAEISDISYESPMVGMIVAGFMIVFLLLGYLISRLIKISILRRFFLGTLIIIDFLFILWTLLYLSL